MSRTLKDFSKIEITEEQRERFLNNQNLSAFVFHKEFSEFKNYQEDIIQEGYKALWKCCIQYDANKNTKFSTYAFISIKTGSRQGTTIAGATIRNATKQARRRIVNQNKKQQEKQRNPTQPAATCPGGTRAYPKHLPNR